MALTAGTPTVSTAQQVFGTGSILGAGSMRITTSKNSTEWNADNWTWEGRYRRTSNSGYHGLAFFTDNLQIRLDDSTGGSGTWRLRIILDGVQLAISSSASTLNTWDGWAVSVSKAGATYTYRILFNGALETSGTSGNANMSLSQHASTSFELGRQDSAGFAGMTGYMEECRVTTVCRYTATYALATEAFPNSL